MALRKCAVCPNDLPAGATARAKYCSTTCRVRAHRTGGAQLSVVKADAGDPTEAPADPAPGPRPSSRLESLEAAAERLVRFLEEADPRSAAPLNKEYRETLREIEVLSASGEQGGQGGGRNRERRPFSPAAI